MESVFPENLEGAPRPSRTASMVSTSFMRGTLWSTVRPGARSAAAMSFRAAFFAPETSTSPQSRFPPSIKNLSTTILLGARFSIALCPASPGVQRYNYAELRLQNGYNRVTTLFWPGGSLPRFALTLTFAILARHPHEIFRRTTPALDLFSLPLRLLVLLIRGELRELVLGLLDTTLGLIDIYLVGGYGLLDQYLYQVLGDLKEAIRGRKDVPLVILRDSDSPNLDRRDHRRVVDHHADVPVRNPRDHQIRLAIVKHLLGRDHPAEELAPLLVLALRQLAFLAVLGIVFSVLQVLFFPFFLFFLFLTARAAGLLYGLVYVADHVEGLLRQVVVLTFDDLLEGADGAFQLHELARHARKLLGHEERLREEALYPARPVDDDLVLLGELLHTEDVDDVLQLLVALHNVLHPLGHLVVLVADDARVQNRRNRVQGVDRRVDALLGQVTRQLHRRVEVGERGERGRVCVVVRRDKDRLEARDRALLCRGDPLLKRAHLGCERRLVADLRGHPAHKRGNLIARLHEAEDVVDEQEHVLAHLVPEVLGEGDPGKAHAEAGAGRLVHLAEDHRRVLEDAGLLHLVVELVPLARPLAHAGEDARTLVLQRDVVDKLGDHDRLADAGPTKEADLTAAHNRTEEVYDLDAGYELLGLAAQVRKLWGRTVYRPVIVRVLDRALLVYRLAKHIQEAPE